MNTDTKIWLFSFQALTILIFAAQQEELNFLTKIVAIIFMFLWGYYFLKDMIDGNKKQR